MRRSGCAAGTTTRAERAGLPDAGFGAGPADDGFGAGRALRRLKLLADLSDDQLARFVQFVAVQRLPQWSTIVRQGDRGNAMYLVFEGRLSVRMKVDGAVTTLGTLGPGDFFGDLALFDQGPRSADVVADTSVVLLRISSAAFAELVEEAPDVASPFLLAMGRTLSARIRTGNKHQSEAAKYARVTG